MFICPLCNGLQQVEVSCKSCNHLLSDKGKITDYLDSYSAYEESTTLKLVDGVEDSITNHQCIHYFYCENCEREEHVIIEE